MNAELLFQRETMKEAISFINRIEGAEEKIKDGNHVEYFRSIKTQAINQYTSAMERILESASKIAKVPIEA